MYCTGGWAEYWETSKVEVHIRERIPASIEGRPTKGLEVLDSLMLILCTEDQGRTSVVSIS